MSIAILREPSIYILARQRVNEPALDLLLSDEGATEYATDTTVAAERLIEIGGRMCYQSFTAPRPGGNAAYITRLLESGHGSVLEHTSWTFAVTGVSRSLSHELVRHRVGMGISQLSQRYVDESSARYVEPDVIACDREAHNTWIVAIELNHQKYVSLAASIRDRLAKLPRYACPPCLGLGKLYPPASEIMVCQACQGGGVQLDKRTELRKEARQAARSVLPNAIETKLVLTFNARALRHFIEQRASLAAEAEIRKLALAFLRLMQTESPNLFGDYVIKSTADNILYAETPYRKV